MAQAPVLAALTTPPPSPSPKQRTHTIPSSPSPEPTNPPHEFHYSRASPSVRWPHLKLHDPPISPPPIPSLDVPDHFDPQASDDDDDRYGPPSDPPESSTRTRVKKMNKLALKRAKDWRERVGHVTDRILALGPTEFVADVLDRCTVQMTPTDLSFVVKWIGRSSWRRSLEVYEWLTLRRRYSPNPRMLAAVLSVLGKANQERLAEEVFARADPEAVESVQVYNAMMGAYARNGRYSKVVDLLVRMRERGLEPDLVSFNILVNARAKSGSIPPGSAMEILSEVRRSGLRPDTITYNTIIAACADPEEAGAVRADMARSRCQPDLWTYNALISVHSRRGEAGEAMRLFRELKREGFHPDAVTFNSLVYAFAREGDTENADEVCVEMARAGFQKDEITYNTLIGMYGKQGMHDRAVEVCREMRSAGRSLDSVTFTVLIDSLGNASRMAEAPALVSGMLDAGVRPTLRVFSALMCGYAKAGMRGEAERTFDQMVRAGIKPDRLAYSVMIDVLFRSDNTGRAMGLYKEMVREGFAPDEGLYQVMVHGLVKAGKHEEIERLIGDMEEVSGMIPNRIALVLVKGEFFERGVDLLKLAVIRGYGVDRESLVPILNHYSSLGMIDEVKALLDFVKIRMPDSLSLIAEASISLLCSNGQSRAAMDAYNELAVVALDCVLYESLITCCEKAESFSEASQVFSDMQFYGIKPSENIYRSIITVYCEMGYPETAHHLLNRAEKVGNIVFNSHSLHVLVISAYGKYKQWKRAEEFVGKLRQKSKIDRKVWNALINAYAMSGQYEQARAVFNTMVRDGPPPSVDSVNGLMQALIVDGRLDELYVVVQELQDMGFKMSKSTIILMLDAFAKAGNIFEVKKIYHGMKEAGYLPTMHLYRSMIGLLSRGKRVRDVELMVAEMGDAGFKADLFILNALLKMYTGIGDVRKAIGTYRRIQELGFEADEDTYNTLMLMYSRDHRPEEGFSLLHEMRKRGLEPKLDTYKSLLAACGKQQLWEQAEGLFEEIRSRGFKLDRSVYHTMMKIFRDSGDHTKAKNMLCLMKEAGVEPSVATMHILMVSYGTARKPQEAENVLNSLKTSGLELSTLTYSSVIDAYLKNGDYSIAIKKLIEMREEGTEPDHMIWTCFVRGASLCQQSDEAMLLLGALRDTGFDLPLRLLVEKADSLVGELDILLEQLGSIEENASFNFVNALEDLLWAFERRATASWLFQLAIKKNVYRHDVFRVADKDWGADFRKLSAGAALVGLTLWLDSMQDASLQGLPESPKSVVLITGTAEYHMVSLNNTLKAYLWEMGSPFLPCKTRSGLLVAKSHSLRMWLKDSSFCMDLELKDASSLPKSNSMCLTNGYFMRAGLAPVFKDIHERLGQVRPKKFARLALLSDESRDKVIKADIEGRKEKLEKMKKGIVNPRKPTKFRRRKFLRRQHQPQI
ncbi:Pentatricopeptide repeat-containing protein [Acorus gramineus]|uniref:Pentatricopeptide repeat-containing protein n=1 Tax=Acorus gramineus TaxID=55184 RepID=A0AAV9ACE2_ACOGR|nr:Pentatricopeptide repeat-containing protein [Acorus gramineus]